MTNKQSIKPKYYECDICGYIHPWEWDGDCRYDAKLFTDECLDKMHGQGFYELATMEERIATDEDREGG